MIAVYSDYDTIAALFTTMREAHKYVLQERAKAKVAVMDNYTIVRLPSDLYLVWELRSDVETLHGIYYNREMAEDYVAMKPNRTLYIRKMPASCGNDRIAAGLKLYYVLIDRNGEVVGSVTDASEVIYYEEPKEVINSKWGWQLAGTYWAPNPLEAISQAKQAWLDARRQQTKGETNG